MWASVFTTNPRPSADTGWHWVPFSSSHSAHRLSHHTSPSPSSQLGESSTANFPEHQTLDSSKPLGTSFSWGISPASSLGCLNLNSHLLHVLLWLVKCHPLYIGCQISPQELWAKKPCASFWAGFPYLEQSCCLKFGSVKGKKKKMYRGKA